MSEWEEVANDPWTLRLKVPGGWLYNVVSLSESGQQYLNAVTFVPDAAAQPEESQPHAFEWAPADQHESHCCRCGKGIEEHAAAQSKEKVEAEDGWIVCPRCGTTVGQHRCAAAQPEE